MDVAKNTIEIIKKRQFRSYRLYVQYVSAVLRFLVREYPSLGRNESFTFRDPGSSDFFPLDPG
jgi:hypothetical protein